MISLRSPLAAVALALFASTAAGCPRAPASVEADGASPAAADASPHAVASASAPTSRAASSGSLLSHLVPPPRLGPRSASPLTIEPGVAFGPVALGETLADLAAGGLVVVRASADHAEVELPGAGGKTETLKLSLCDGKIIDIWIDDLRRTSSAVTYAGTTIAPTLSRDDVEKLLGPCAATDPRIGGAFERCHDGGVYVGHGMGNFLQIRVRPRAFPFDDACAVATDDGSPIALSPAERTSLLSQTLNVRELGDHWHVDRPGRDPLRVVRTPNVPEQAMTMFGSPVAWIDEADAKKGTAFFAITSLAATKTKATLEFAYPIEGVTGTVSFARSSGDTRWRLVKSELRER